MRVSVLKSMITAKRRLRATTSSRVHHLDNKQCTRSNVRAYDSYQKQISGNCEKPSPQFRPETACMDAVLESMNTRTYHIVRGPGRRKEHDRLS